VEQRREAVAVHVDITDQASVRAMAALAKDAFGGVDILVNNAGLMAELSRNPPAIQTPIDEWNRVLAVNLTGALNCCQAVVPQMQERGGGKIVNQASAAAFPANTVYGISKLALVGLTHTLARELGPVGINVNAIAPGYTMTDAAKALPRDETLSRMLDMMVAMRGEGRPDELVGALLLLCSDAGSWITGQVLNVDGGLVMRL
jgi:NAD(P)-dependent dehydrogenase (short-subunit alcohol dehydrogenase family)